MMSHRAGARSLLETVRSLSFKMQIHSTGAIKPRKKVDDQATVTISAGDLIVYAYLHE